MFGRLVGTLLLLYLSIPNTLRCQPPMGWSSGTSTTECPDYFLSLTFVSYPVISFGRYTRLATFQQLYTSVLSVIALISRTWSSAATRSNIVTLLSAFFVYAYRDLWPLATYTQNPADEAEGSVLWAKIAILAVIAVVIPLFIPRRYVPVDSKVILVPHIFVKAASDDLGVVEPDACAQCWANLILDFEAYFLLHGPYYPLGFTSFSYISGSTTSPCWRRLGKNTNTMGFTGTIDVLNINFWLIPSSTLIDMLVLKSDTFSLVCWELSVSFASRSSSDRLNPW